ncbi:ADP-glyceromanno-heptose 6-epimerase [Candidatus Blochmannia ocreatus (nom. nud.)]|uniref:ADP-L-glycero-D-manno-heptose-6-epimerase n=1 Tax=Candidatus Blochmannia ocreatus (nom. nud.) TaxID=251538 RepID=A0ABY4SU77_9ENTR|nr:ADP-glyceromanno-heptose 6-epimerase [Candidatus Blochmannia ocreatus]URJ25436.1 ADP-glyceromanno-heptose 6-epimerase [Candidatus Blochmannia ocreatus]
MIIVTGGAGFVGCNLIRALNKIKRKDILVVDNLKNGKKYVNLIGLYITDYIDKNYFLKCLLTEPSYINNIDVVFHQGACSSTIEWDGEYMMRNNYQYSKELLSYCIKNHIPFIYASSASVYGKSTDTSLEHKQREKPINIYSYSKFLFDQYVRSILPKVTSQICGLRYFNVYGPYEMHKGNMASIIYRLYTQIKSKKHIKLFCGSNDIKRDFVYISDIVDINIWAWDTGISGIFDCGTGESQSFELIANIVLDFFDRDLTIKYIPMPSYLCNHYQFFTRANVEQLRIVGYEKKFFDVKNGIFNYLNWLLYNGI